MKRKIILLLILIIVLASITAYFLIGKNVAKEENFWSSSGSEIKTSDINGVSFKVTFLDFAPENPLRFDVKIDTHTGSLDFDLAKVSFLEDDKGNKYEPLEWQGPPPGGHHLEGILIFPVINKEANKIKLNIQDNFQRAFEWNL
ncbi:MAG: hypothetical protein Q8P06_02535 [Candidatus Azambacteria bacterium]|nr:hypothetical protein [Candidatus Azambacteria bacterium]